MILSEPGIRQSKDMGQRYRHERFDAVFCSDLRRSYHSAENAFEGRFTIIKDWRLRECDYGHWTRRPSTEIEAERPNRITQPFPNGESYEQTSRRMKSFLQDLLRDYNGKRVMIVGHRATQYGLEHWINGVPLKKAVTDPWRWQPGWEYRLKQL